MTLHDEVEIEDMEWNESLQAFTYECPCGDLFQITLQELQAVIYDPEDFSDAALGDTGSEPGVVAA
ncbi:hypothetical protein QBZ16_002239 [Prototheca wickerhamii]|uniref:Diphthamide biosynthesis protein 3 n=1 Tax=Prototheca wickerhamii TaxID=3111 RepID=A0AAD9MIA3_PROWI|nr:hypothetical protein QBZ16_002239 [Prototheca wickerhamii]